MRDCQMALEDGKELSKEESSARESLLRLCRELADEYLDEYGEVKNIRLVFEKWVEAVDMICCESDLTPLARDFCANTEYQASEYGKGLTPESFVSLAEGNFPWEHPIVANFDWVDRGGLC
jgi:hypothetical protein